MLNKHEIQEIFAQIRKITVKSSGEDIAELEKKVSQIASSHLDALEKIDEQKTRMSIPWPITPIKFHSYRSVVFNRIIEMNLTEESEELRKELITTFNEAGIKCHDNNKIVFECEFEGIKIYYGFYDLKFSIGLRYKDDNEK